jgi:hypothetical protein
MAHRGRVVKYCLARAAGCALAATFILTACAMSTGIVPYGPGVFLVSEMRAPVLGGAAEAQRVALGEANDFCAHQGLVFAPVMMGPGGYPYSDYGPTNFSASFRCLAAGDPAIAASRAAFGAPR